MKIVALLFYIVIVTGAGLLATQASANTLECISKEEFIDYRGTSETKPIKFSAFILQYTQLSSAKVEGSFVTRTPRTIEVCEMENRDLIDQTKLQGFTKFGSVSAFSYYYNATDEIYVYVPTNFTDLRQAFLGYFRIYGEGPLGGPLLEARCEIKDIF